MINSAGQCSRRKALLAGAAFAVAPFAARAYPERLIRMIVPQGPGGPTDILARVIGQRLQAAFGLIVLAVLAVLGFAVIAALVAIAVVILLIYRLRAWLVALFSGRPMPPARTDHRVIDVQYEIVDKKNDDHR